MSNKQVFLMQMTLTVVIYSLIANWYLAPALAHLPVNETLAYLLIPHALRHIGMTAIVPDVVDANSKIPKQWSRQLGYGDLLTAVLALFTIWTLKEQWSFAIAMVWITNVVGTVDSVNVSILSTKHGVYDHGLGGFWFVPTFFVPILIVTHVWIFWILLH
jgi:hypothetical protein